MITIALAISPFALCLCSCTPNSNRHTAHFTSYFFVGVLNMFKCRSCILLSKDSILSSFAVVIGVAEVGENFGTTKGTHYKGLAAYRRLYWSQLQRKCKRKANSQMLLLLLHLLAHQVVHGQGQIASSRNTMRGGRSGSDCWLCNCCSDPDRETPAASELMPESIMFPVFLGLLVLAVFCGEEEEEEAGGSPPAVNAGDDESGGGTPLSRHDHNTHQIRQGQYGCTQKSPRRRL